MSSGRRHRTFRTVIFALFSYPLPVSFVPSAHFHRALTQWLHQRFTIDPGWAQAQDARRAEMELRAELEANRAGGYPSQCASAATVSCRAREAALTLPQSRRSSLVRAFARWGSRAGCRSCSVRIAATTVGTRTAAQAALTRATGPLHPAFVLSLLRARALAPSRESARMYIRLGP